MKNSWSSRHYQLQVLFPHHSHGKRYDLPLTVFSFSPLIYLILFLSHNSLYTQNGTSCFPLDEEIIDIKRIKSHLHGLPWNLMDIHELWTSMEIHGFCVDFHGHPRIVDIHGDPSILCGLPWRSITSWTSMEIHHFMDFHGDPSFLCGTPWRSITSWTSMEIHRFPVELHGDPSLRGHPWRSMVSVWTSMGIHRFVDIHGDPLITLLLHTKESHALF